MTYSFQKEVPNVDPALWHPLLVQRWWQLFPMLTHLLNCNVIVNEGYRPDLRQQWLYGQGRTAAQLKVKGIDPSFARPGLIVTNAWSAKTSPHGLTLPIVGTGEWPDGRPAACALDIIVLGQDGKPWTKDDPWDEFIKLTTDDGPLTNYGLVHFKGPRNIVTDGPHLQMIEYDNHTHNLLV